MEWRIIEFNYPEGATPLDPNEIEGLIPTNITKKAELDRWEQDNINEALVWIKNLNEEKNEEIYVDDSSNFSIKLAGKKICTVEFELKV